MSNMLNRAKQAAATLTTAVVVSATTAAPALAWGHTPGDKARNAAVVIGGLAVAVAAMRSARCRPGQNQKNNLG